MKLGVVPNAVEECQELLHRNKKMINRNNWKLTKKYKRYRSEIDQLSLDSLKQEQVSLRYVLEWAQETPFLKASDIRPTLPEYLISARSDALENQFSREYVKRLLTNAKRFFVWLEENEKGYKQLNKTWIKKIKPPRMVEIPKNKEAVTLDEILVIAGLPVGTVQDQRIQAMACFLYLSGMRIGAFVSMPLKAVDVENRIVYQHPNLGVRTKNKKHATTFLLDIFELLEVVKKWDFYVRSILPEDGFWFAPLHQRTGDVDEKNLNSTQTRTSLARRNLDAWCKKNEIKYHNPHAFRHGHIHFGLKYSKNMEDFKAVSLNVMHSNMGITDKYYSRLSSEVIKLKIDKLGKTSTNSGANEELIRRFLEWQEKRP